MRRLPALLVVLMLTAAPTPAPRAAQNDRSAPLFAGNLIQFFGK